MQLQPIDLVAIAGSTLILGTVVGLIASGGLKPRYAILWLLASGALMVVSLWRGLIDVAAETLGVAYRPAVVFLAADLFLMLILLHMSVVISRMTDRIRTLAQDAALLRDELERRGASGDDG